MKAKTKLLLWILVVPLIMYLGFATIVVWPILLGWHEIREIVASPVSILFLAWANAYYYIVSLAFAPLFVILVAVWVIGYRQLYRNYVKEKADSRQKV